MVYYNIRGLTEHGVLSHSAALPCIVFHLKQFDKLVVLLLSPLLYFSWCTTIPLFFAPSCLIVHLKATN